MSTLGPKMTSGISTDLEKHAEDFDELDLGNLFNVKLIQNVLNGSHGENRHRLEHLNQFNNFQSNLSLDNTADNNFELS